MHPITLKRSLLTVLLLLGLCVPVFRASGQVQLESTFYYDGNIDNGRWRSATIDVDVDGTIAVAVTGNIGGGNEPGVHRARILLYDKDGVPIAEIAAARNTSFSNISFGPDGMIYTAEGWFGAGTHIYDRPFWKNRFIAKRHLRADGAHVDRGSPTDIAVTKELTIYTIMNKQVTLLSLEDTVLSKMPWANHTRLDLGADGRLYSGNKVLVDNVWQDFPYFVLDIAPSGKMLVRDPGGWAIYNPATETLEVKGKYPPKFSFGDAALGADDRVFITSTADQGLAFAAIDAGGNILFQRGADYDRLRVTLPGDAYVAGQPVSISAEIIRSRDMGMVPADRILPADNRPELRLTASAAPAVYDPLAERVWHAVPLEMTEAGQYQLTFPAQLTGRFTLRLAATATNMPGSKPLAVTRDVAVAQPGEIAYLQPMTDRKRTAFAPGTPVRLTVPASPSADVDLSNAQLQLLLDGQPVWSAPLGMGTLPAGAQQTAVVVIPPEVTARLRPGVYSAGLSNLPQAVSAGQAVIAVLDPVRPQAFQTPAHTIGPTYSDPLLDAQLIAEWGATHITATAQADPLYLDLLARLGVDYHYQIYGHYAGVHTLPQEQGAAQSWVSEWAQRLEAYPSFTGITYHDLQVQGWGGWWDAPRKPYYDNELWPKWAAEVTPPATLPENIRGNWSTAQAVQGMLTRLYDQLNSAIDYANPRLQRTTMQWWHQPLYIADPDKVAAGQTLVTAQHMEEQYYHPITNANMADLWRRPGKDLWVYGNNSWQDDGTGALQYTDMMASLFRGAQGVGRNAAPKVGDERAEYGIRAATPFFQFLHRYGGLSAAAQSVDQVAVWRSMYQECSEYPRRPSEEMHMSNIAAAYTACLYGHYTAGIVTDEQVRAGALKRYKALIISFEHPLPAELLTPLQEFQRGGGLVLANRPARGYWAPENAIELGAAFRGSFALAHANRDSLRHIGIEEDGLRGAEILQTVLAPRLERVVDCNVPTVWLSMLQSGDARYLWAVNVTRLPQDPMDLHRYSGYENTRLPVKTLLRIPPGNYVIYDVLSGKKVTPVEQNGRRVIPADMSIFPGAIFALLPEEIAGINLLADVAKPVTGAWNLAVRAQVTATRDQQLRAAVPLAIRVTDTAGKVRYQIYRTAVDGLCNIELPIAANDSPGSWRVAVRELLSGHGATADIAVATPPLPTVTPAASTVEWGRATRVTPALQQAKTVAIVAQQQDELAPAIDALAQYLQGLGKDVIHLTPKDYLADLDTLHWKGFPEKHGVAGDFGKIEARTPKYGLVVTLETPKYLTGVVKADVLPMVLSATDPGPGRGLVQYAATPVYNDEDIICLAGGDAAGLLAAVHSLATPRPVTPATAPTIALKPLTSRADQIAPAGIAEFIGIEISQLAVSADGQRIAAGLRGWGNNLLVLDANGTLLNKDVSGKFFPLALQPVGDGFAVISHENDPTTMYLKIYDRAGTPVARLAAMGRRIGGVRDCTPNYPSIMRERFLPQTAFSMADDLSLAAVAGSNGIAVWDMAARTVLWRDDSMHYLSPQIESSAWPNTASFPQLRISGDGKWLIVQHAGRVMVRDARNGTVLMELRLPPGTEGGRVQLFDGRQLVIGDGDYFGFSIDNAGAVQSRWHYKAPKSVTASVFNADGLRYALGEVDGTLRIMQGGGQIAGYLSPGPGGAIACLDALPDFSRIAFTTTSGFAGVLDARGTLLWQTQVSGPAVIRFLGTDGATVLGDRRGYLRWYDAAGKETRSVDLTPQVWRDDIVDMLTREDPTPALRAGPSPAEAQRLPVPDGVDNLAKSAKFTYITGRSWWNERITPDRSVPLNDGSKEAPANGWFDRTKLEYLAFVPGPAAWEISWDTPQTVDTLVGYEANPGAVPQEIRLEAWIDDNWQVVSHVYWNDQPTHVHRFAPVTTTKLRYFPIGDLANGVYLSEIEVYNSGLRL